MLRWFLTDPVGSEHRLPLLKSETLNLIILLVGFGVLEMNVAS